MDTLPNELCNLIIEYIPPGRDRAAMAAVSRRFQSLVEPYTLKRINLDDYMLPSFNRLFRSDHRRSLLRKLTYDITIPARSKNQTGFILRDSISRLLVVMAPWGNVEQKYLPRDAWVHVHINQTYTPNDHRHTVSLGVRPHSSNPSYARSGNPAYNQVFLNREYDILTEEALDRLATVSCISGFAISLQWPDNVLQINISTDVLIKIATKMPNLRELKWEIIEHTPKLNSTKEGEYTRWLDLGSALLKACQGGVFDNLRAFYFGFKTPTDPLNLSGYPGYLGKDYLSRGINAVCRLPNMRSVVAHKPLCISPELFWPQIESLSSSLPPSWPSLENLEIKIHPVSSFGHSMCFHPIGQGIQPGTQQISSLLMPKINEQHFNPIVLALAKAVAHMEKISRVRFTMVMPWISHVSVVELVFLASGVRHERADRCSGAGNPAQDFIGARWIVNQMRDYNWDISAEIQEALWEGVGEEGMVMFSKNLNDPFGRTIQEA